LFMTVILLILAIIDSQLLSISAKIREKDWQWLWTMYGLQHVERATHL
jgi:hypothetical protein